MNTKTAREKEKWMRGKLFILVLFFLFVFSSLGIAGKGEIPKSCTINCKPLSKVECTFMPPQDTRSLMEEDRRRERIGIIQGPYCFATSINSNLNLENSGTWEPLPEDSHLWRLQIISKGAKSLNLGITTFELPTGAKLWIYEPSGCHVEGPYITKHRSAQGQLWTPIVPGDKIVVELYVPGGGRDKTNIKIGKVNHAYCDCFDRTRSGACNIDTICQPEGYLWRDQIRSVAYYHFTDSGLCMIGSGVLINNTKKDGKPYFLTAWHNGVRRRNVHTMVIYWNCESKNCGARSGGRTDNNQTGATFCVRSISSDFLLVELNERPNPKFNVYYSGWDATGNKPLSVVGIHHPRGKEKAICFAYDPLTSSKLPSDIIVINNEKPENLNYWRVKKWDRGTTECGSSGSGLWDKKSKLLVGQLYGGDAACSGSVSNKRPCWYGKFSASWKHSAKLRKLLDPDGTLNGKESSLEGIDYSATRK